MGLFCKAERVDEKPERITEYSELEGTHEALVPGALAVVRQEFLKRDPESTHCFCENMFLYSLSKTL